MPRDGSGIFYNPLGTEGIPDTTIESAKYNGYINDVAQDLNAPRPIIAGGTGAQNAADALAALSGEMAKQLVTNYDSHLFVAGSFYSAPGATAAPTTGAYAGICYVGATPAEMIIEARSLDDATNPGRKYVRQKRVGVWGSWSMQVGSVTESNDLFVNVSGDSMTGDLIMTRTAAPTTGYTFYGNAGKYFGHDGAQMTTNAPLDLPASPAPLANHAIRQDYMKAADDALRTDYDAKLALKAPTSSLPQTASAAEFRSNSAPSKMLTPGAVWAAAGIVGLGASQQIDFAAGFDFVIPGGNIWNPINAKQGQKGCIYIYGAIGYWGTSWKFPNGVKPVHSGGSDCMSYWVYDPNSWIFCTYTPNHG